MTSYAPRTSGRTTRMLQHAFNLAKEHKAVYVMAASNVHKQNLEKEWDLLFPEHAGPENGRLGVKFEVPYGMGNFNWQTFQLKGAHPRCVVLADHFTIESQFPTLLEMLHRYDG